MFYYLATFVFIFHVPVATLAIECMVCDQDLVFNSSDVLNATRPECAKQNEVGDLCVGMLSTEFQNKNATTYLTHLPNQVLTFSNGNKMVITTTTIYLSKNLTTQTVQAIGTDSAAIAEDISNGYNRMKILNEEALRVKLNEHLHTPLSYVPDLTCFDNSGQSITCPNGFCQLSSTNTIIGDRRCIPQGKTVNPSGMLIQSTDMEGSNTTDTIIYACNRAMCNGAETHTKVRELLREYGLITTKDTTSATITPYQTMMHFSWLLLLTMSSLSKIF